MTEAPYSYPVSPEASAAHSVELCPPHWRLPPTRSVREKLRDILLKNWQGASPHTPQERSPQKRPSTMRMKGSDDYITARAANPRTGLISPSVGSCTPRLSPTPGSPGSALKRAENVQPPSPTPDTKARPALRRANEGRKVSVGSAKWRADGNGWLVDSFAAVASPRLTDLKADAGLVSSNSQAALRDDKFVVHMPSAHEPQPYAYPGYCTKQIEAFEHYKKKTRRVSSEGYDQRILDEARQTSGGIRKLSVGKVSEKSGSVHSLHNVGGAQVKDGGITVVKQRVRIHDLENEHNELPCTGGAEFNAATFAPFASPRAPSLRSSENSFVALDTMPGSPKHINASATVIHRKPVDSTWKQQTISPNAGATNNHHCFRNDRKILQDSSADVVPTIANLRHLPRVALVHPYFASLPQEHPLRQSDIHDAPRKCSFGRLQDTDGNCCVGQKLTSVASTSTAEQSLFGNAHGASRTDTSDVSETQQGRNRNARQAEHTSPLLDILITGVVSTIDATRRIHLPAWPQIGVLNVLNAPDTTPQQKVYAIKTILSSTGQALAILTFIAMLWQAGSVVMHALEIFFWPLLVPFKIARWLASSG